MNRENWSETDKDCNVCGSAVEVGTASSRCSNRNCPTREGAGIHSSNVSTDSTAQDVYEHFKSKDTIERERVDGAVEEAYREFKNADSHEKATTKNGAVKALLPLSSYSGFGELRMEVDA